MCNVQCTEYMQFLCTLHSALQILNTRLYKQCAKHLRVFFIYNGSLLTLYIRLHSVRAQWAGLCIRLLWNFASLISPGFVEHTVLLLWTIIIIKITYYIFTDLTWWNTQFSFYNCPTLPIHFQFQISLRCLCDCSGGFPKHSFVCKIFWFIVPEELSVCFFLQ